MLQRELTREQVMHTGEQILVSMEQPIIERGYTYFSQGVVFNTRVENGSTLMSNVQGTHVYQVSLELNTVQNSTCSCPYTRLCKHIAATFFQMYSVFDNPRNFLALAQQPRRAKFSAAMLAPAYKNVGRASSDGVSVASVQSSLTPASSVDEWWTFMQSWTRNLASAMESYRASSELFSSCQNVLGVAAAWPEEIAQLFAIHATVFHILKLQEFVTTNRQSHWSSDLSQTAEKLVEQVESILYYLDVEQLRKQHPLALEETWTVMKRVRQYESGALYGIFACRMLWGKLLSDPAWIQAEVRELEELLIDPAASDSAKEKYRVLRAHFFVLEGRDEAAIQIWLPMHKLTLSFFLPYLKSFARNGQWQRFLDWIQWLEQLIGESDPQQYRFMTAVWHEAMEQTGRADECGAQLKRFLPRSFAEYAAFLLDSKEFKQWIDLQMSFRVPFAEIPALQIKQIEEEHPTLLFPLYLREINRLINERNRSTYKEAIRLVKKVRTVYAKANQDAQWERYVDQLSSKYNRLRAFQEELRRGNLNV